MTYRSFLAMHDGSNWSWHRALWHPLGFFADVGVHPFVFVEADGELRVGLGETLAAELVVGLAEECGAGSGSFSGVGSLWPFVARDHAPCE